MTGHAAVASSGAPSSAWTPDALPSSDPGVSDCGSNRRRPALLSRHASAGARTNPPPTVIGSCINEGIRYRSAAAT